MKIKYISLKLSKQIAEIAKEKGVELPESEAAWVDFENSATCCGKGKDCDCYRGKYHTKRFQTLECPYYEDDYEEKSHLKIIALYQAYDTFELGEILIENDSYLNEARSDRWIMERDGHTEKGKSEPEVRGKMLLYLLENNLFKTKQK